ncbi:hypothetical protein DFR40_1727 [Azonexus fungiphilus]|jgi:hypothetical protein|uniref:Uncharacterized protein n=1 Tax=Azonexus fungiphilus TaxID=146940 RepID=A0A495WD71_9RHOO|nr:hypothetical protein [Azonexus fungiphilus]NHC06411.1 hypothetical protein [Azonexus fungiphilus]RKT58705.1 hypothetical protein DFR40_1727 [Azonexus fungiphilus]
MELTKRFSDRELEQIVEEATIYMCACPGQVAAQLRSLRELFRYQLQCEVEPGNDLAVHRAIADATARAHVVMEACMEEVLAIEGWDRKTLQMPEGLRRKRSDLLAAED